MAMPKRDSTWPPAPYGRAFADIDEWSVWWEGTHSRLANYYRPGETVGKRPGARGILASATSFFGSESGTARGPKNTSLTIHLPLAADIFRLVATLLYADPPMFKPEADEIELPVEPPEADPITGEVPEPEPAETVTIMDQAAMDRLDEIANDDRTQATLLAHGEATSALGGGALRVVWDVDAFADGPWLEHIDADMCIPEYNRGRLEAVLFWSEYRGDGDVIYRHFERYVAGGIEHALYEGSSDNVGRPTALTELARLGGPDLDYANMIADESTGQSMVPHEYPKLAAVYVPNRRPNPKWRKNDKLKMLGTSDVSMDIMPLLAAADEVFSSLMRDVRQGKGRVIVSDSLLQVIGGGRGAWLDADAEYVERVGDSLDADGKPLMEQVQFAIREGAHLTILEAIIREVLRRVGISPLTFGLGDGVAATTATEIRANTRDTIATVKAKRRLASPELSDVVTAMMAIDAEFFDGPGLGDGTVDVHWPPEVVVSDLEKAQTLTLIGDSMSLYERVKYLHDDWDDGQILAEVRKIKDDAPDPPSFDPFGGAPEGPVDQPNDAAPDEQGAPTDAVPDSTTS